MPGDSGILTGASPGNLNFLSARPEADRVRRKSVRPERPLMAMAEAALPLPGLDGMVDAPRDGNVSRANSLYGVHAYHTKVPPEAIERYLREHLPAGGIVLDPFCGSGMTGVAARRLGLHAKLSDLSPAAVHIASNYTSRCNPVDFNKAAERVAGAYGDARRRLYGTSCHACGGPAMTAYVIWSDLRRCPHCVTTLTVWDQRSTGLRQLRCPGCAESFAKKAAAVVGEKAVRVSLDCPGCGRLDREPTSEDLELVGTSRSDIPDWYPEVPFTSDREMWRRGHEDLGIRSVADFYSPRNLWALSILWAEVEREPDPRVRSGLRFAFTAMANRASRRYQWNAKRPTNVLGGTLYVSSLRYEFNVFSLWSRKVSAVRRFFESTLDNTGTAEVIQASATHLPYADQSVDYCFTDPPFGANIVYSDCSLLWESWLGDLTDPMEEAVVTRHRPADSGGKTVGGYAQLMTAAFGEIRRVLKPGAATTVVFQNTDPAVWEAVQGAMTASGFEIVGAETLHKSQPSFKGVKAQEEGEQVAATDVVLLLRTHGVARPAATPRPLSEVVWPALLAELEQVGAATGRRRSTAHLYAVAVAAAVAAGVPATEITFDGLETMLRERCIFDDGWRVEVSLSVSP